MFAWHILIPLLAWEPAPAGGAPEGGLLGTLLSNPLLPMLMIGVVFYMMMMRPEQRKRKEMEQLLANIQKNDKVITVGGICGTVVNASPKSTYVTLRVDDNTKLRVLRSAISRVGHPEEVPSDGKDSA